MGRQGAFAGREHELGRLGQHLHKALSGKGQICFVIGQAGSGKTALVQHFAHRAVAGHPKLVLVAGTSNAQTGIGDPYLPFREALAMLTGDAPGKQALKITSENESRLRTALVRSVQILVEVGPELVNVLVPGSKLLGELGKAVAEKAGWMDRLEKLTGQQRSKHGGMPAIDQSRIFEQYTAFIQRLSAEMPLIVFLDDLQWADSASTSLLFHLARRIEDHPILIVGAYRPSDVALGRAGERHPLEPVVNELVRYCGEIVIDLDHIPEAANRQFMEALVSSQLGCLADEFQEKLFQRTSGHALFTVELVQTMQARGDLVQDSTGCWVEKPFLDWSALPAKVEGVIAERIDRLDEEKRKLITAASVEGEEFTAEVVAQVERITAREAVRQLSELQRQHNLVIPKGVFQIGRARLSRYRFAHSLFQQYLYDNLDAAERSYLHQEMGELLETLFNGRAEEASAQLARHFEQAGIAQKAVRYRMQAGSQAWHVSAHQEAAEHFIRGLVMTLDLPRGPESMQLELDLQTALGTVFVTLHGYASSRVHQAFARAQELAHRLGNPGHEIPVLYGLTAFHFVRGELGQAIKQGQRLLELARHVGDTRFNLGCELVLGAVALHQGEFERAREHLEEVIRGYDVHRHRSLVYFVGHDPCVGALSYLSLVLWQQGYLEQAVARKDAALTLAKEIAHPYTIGYAASFASMLAQMLKQLPDCVMQAEVARQLGKEGPFPSWEAIGRISRGWALAHLRQAEEGIAELVQGMALWAKTESRLAMPYQHTLLADAYLAAGKREEGLKALGTSPCCPEEFWWLSEQDRVRGELLLLSSGNEGEAEVHFQKALEVARSRGARSFELRAAMSLARLLIKQERAQEACAVLSPRYAWFTEGLDTADLREARALLEGLAG